MDWDLICWRGAVASAIRGKRGQALLREMLVAFDGLSAHRLIAHELEAEGEVCALGALGRARGLDLSAIDDEGPDEVAAAFGMAPALAKEIAFINDEAGPYGETPENRFVRVRAWLVAQIRS